MSSTNRSHREGVSRCHVWVSCLSCAFIAFFWATPAFAGISGGLDGITARILEVNTWLIALGSVFAVTGFIWAVLAFMGRLGGFSTAISTLFAGLAVANAKEIVGFFIG